MIEDKLTRDERIRLEALAQAINSMGHVSSTPSNVIIVVADKFENYIRNGTS